MLYLVHVRFLKLCLRLFACVTALGTTERFNIDFSGIPLKIGNGISLSVAVGNSFYRILNTYIKGALSYKHGNAQQWLISSMLCRSPLGVFFAIGLMTGTIVQSSTAHATDIEIYNYHNSPPFVLGPDEGLSYDLVNYLNKKGEGRYNFILTNLPRKRLDRILKLGRRVVVPWTSPAWFGDPNSRLFGWTKPIMNDGNVFLSSATQPVEVETVYSLSDMLIGGVLGYRYKDVDHHVELGLLRRTNATNEKALVRMVSNQRVDVGIMSQSTARYLVREAGVEDKVHFGSQKHSTYARRMLINGYMPRLRNFLNNIIMTMERDPEWIATMARYNLQPAAPCERKKSFDYGVLVADGARSVQLCPKTRMEDSYLLGTHFHPIKGKS